MHWWHAQSTFYDVFTCTVTLGSKSWFWKNRLSPRGVQFVAIYLRMIENCEKFGIWSSNYTYLRFLCHLLSVWLRFCFLALWLFFQVNLHVSTDCFLWQFCFWNERFSCTKPTFFIILFQLSRKVWKSPSFWGGGWWGTTRQSKATTSYWCNSNFL